MSVENIIRAWKAEEETEGEWASLIPALPVGEEISEQALEEIVGGICGDNAPTVCRTDW